MASQNKSLIIADSSPLIALTLVRLLPELRSLASEILIPATVEKECTQNLSLPAARQIKQAISKFQKRKK